MNTFYRETRVSHHMQTCIQIDYWLLTKSRIHAPSFCKTKPGWPDDCTCSSALLVQQSAHESSRIYNLWTVAHAIFCTACLSIRCFKSPQRNTGLDAIVDAKVEPYLTHHTFRSICGITADTDDVAAIDPTSVISSVPVADMQRRR